MIRGDGNGGGVDSDDSDEVVKDGVTIFELRVAKGIGIWKFIELHQSSSHTHSFSIPAETKSALTPSGTRKCMGLDGDDPTYIDTSASKSKWS
jgi:hypothetical protein